MFGYVQGLRKALPGMKVSDAIRQFLKSFEIQEDDYCFDTAKQTYYRLLNAILEANQKGGRVDDETII